MSKRNKSKKPRLNIFVGRRGSILILALAAMILVVSAFSMTYSWYSPQVQTGKGANYSAMVKVRSEDCIIVETNELPSNNFMDFSGTLTDISGGQSVSANSIKYFRTVIRNKNINPTNISLYLKAFPKEDSVAKVGLGVANPSNSYHEYTGSTNDVCIVRNAFLYGSNDENYRDLYVVWFVKTSTDSVTVNVTGKDNTIDNNNLYLRYN